MRPLVSAQFRVSIFLLLFVMIFLSLDYVTALGELIRYIFSLVNVLIVSKKSGFP